MLVVIRQNVVDKDIPGRCCLGFPQSSKLFADLCHRGKVLVIPLSIVSTFYFIVIMIFHYKEFMYSFLMLFESFLILSIGVEDRMSVIWEKGVVSDMFSCVYQVI